MTDLEAIKARAGAATAGPWTASQVSVGVATADGRTLVHLAEVLLGDDDTRAEHPQATANAEFIAAARTDVPELVAEVERLRPYLADADPMADPKIGPFVLLAICDPGAYLPRETYHDDNRESISHWSARAVLKVLMDRRLLAMKPEVLDVL